VGVNSVEEALIYSAKYFSFTCSRVADNADTVNRLMMSFGQYIFVHSDASGGHYSSSTYSLCALVNKWLKIEYYWRIVSFFANQHRHSRRQVTKRHSHLLSVERH